MLDIGSVHMFLRSEVQNKETFDSTISARATNLQKILADSAQNVDGEYDPYRWQSWPQEAVVQTFELQVIT